MGSFMPDNSSKTRETLWWQQWKGSNAIILGILAGIAKLSAGHNFSASGICVRHLLNLKSLVATSVHLPLLPQQFL
jgi:hypothetical protein